MKRNWRSATLVAYSFAILAFLYLPLLILSLYSFNDSRINAVWTGFTFKWYAALLENDRALEALGNSLLIASVTTVVSTVMGTLAALALHRYQYKCRLLINSLLYLPILIPEIVMGLSLLVLFPSWHQPGAAHPDHSPHHLLHLLCDHHCRRPSGRVPAGSGGSCQRPVCHPLECLPVCDPAHDRTGDHRRCSHGFHPVHR